jgi:hypothetical protein
MAVRPRLLQYSIKRLLSAFYPLQQPQRQVVITSVADPDPGSGIGCFLTPGSGILDPGSGKGFFRIPDPGSQDHIFKSFFDNFFGKKFYNSLKIGQNFFFSTSKLK